MHLSALVKYVLVRRNNFFRSSRKFFYRAELPCVFGRIQTPFTISTAVLIQNREICRSAAESQRDMQDASKSVPKTVLSAKFLEQIEMVI